MVVWTNHLRPQAAAASTTCLVLGAGVLGISVGVALGTLWSQRPPKRSLIRSPRRTQLPKLSEAEIAALPYPPDVLPGGRDVETPYGCIKVFEWGPEDGEKVLLMHGISTPCVALSNLAEELVARGHRVMLFDFFGRGYSDTPLAVPFDLRLYTTQIMLVLASSSLGWTGDDGFHLAGYSLGGGVAVSFAQYFPHMVRSLVLVAPGGIIRSGHVGWRTRILYSTGMLPEGLLQYLVRQRLLPRKSDTGSSTETKMAGEVVSSSNTGSSSSAGGKSKHKNSDASGGSSFDNAALSSRRPGHTVSSVMNWQLLHHEGFIPAFMSSIRFAPIYECWSDWQALGQLLAARRKTNSGDKGETTKGQEEEERLPGLIGGKILLVLGATDPVIDKEELIHDATAALGEDGFEAILLDSGHELVMAKGKEVADLAVDFWAYQR